MIFFSKDSIVFDIEKGLWKSELPCFWTSKPKRTKALESFCTHQVGAKGKLINSWTQLSSAVLTKWGHAIAHFRKTNGN